MSTINTFQGENCSFFLKVDITWAFRVTTKIWSNWNAWRIMHLHQIIATTQQGWINVWKSHIPAKKNRCFTHEKSSNKPQILIWLRYFSTIDEHNWCILDVQISEVNASTISSWQGGKGYITLFTHQGMSLTGHRLFWQVARVTMFDKVFPLWRVYSKDKVKLYCWANMVKIEVNLADDWNNWQT